MPRTKYNQNPERQPIQCIWKCPCGGVFPNAPEECDFKKLNPNKDRHCVDLVLCMYTCKETKNCDFYQNWKKDTKNRLKKRTSVKTKNPPFIGISEVMVTNDKEKIDIVSKTITKSSRTKR